MKQMIFRRAPIAVAVTVLLLAACGGGGGGGDTAMDARPAASGVPQSATSSSAGALAFGKTLAASTSETSEPIVVGEAQLATSETEEPDPGV